MDVPHVRPDGVRASAQHPLQRARWAGDGADFHQSRLTKLLSHDDHDDEHDGGHFQNCRRPVLTTYPMALSPARQRNGVSEGMAFGLVMLNRNELPSTNKMRIDLAFERAGRDRPDRYKSQFKQVSTDLAKGKDAVWVMTDAEKTKRTAAFYWEWDGGTLSIYGRQTDWDGDDPDDIKFAVDVIDGDVPVEGLGHARPRVPQRLRPRIRPRLSGALVRVYRQKEKYRERS